MSDIEYNIMRKRHCESIVQDFFHLYFPVDDMLFDDIETGEGSYAVIFRSSNYLYALFIDENKKQTLGDVQSMMRNMGVRPLKVFPPHADPDYFIREAERNFLNKYPAIKTASPEAINFYKNFATYTPGLIRIAEINGMIKRYVPDMMNWQNAFSFNFQQIQVS